MSWRAESRPIALSDWQIELLDVVGRRLQDDLELVVVLQPVGVLAVAAVLGAARGLDVGAAPGLGPERAQGGRGVERAGTHLHVVGLQDHAALVRPELLERQDETLEGVPRVHVGRQIGHRVGPVEGARNLV